METLLYIEMEKELKCKRSSEMSIEHCQLEQSEPESRAIQKAFHSKLSKQKRTSKSKTRCSIQQETFLSRCLILFYWRNFPVFGFSLLLLAASKNKPLSAFFTHNSMIYVEPKPLMGQKMMILFTNSRNLCFFLIFWIFFFAKVLARWCSGAENAKSFGTLWALVITRIIRDSII